MQVVWILVLSNVILFELLIALFKPGSFLAVFLPYFFKQTDASCKHIYHSENTSKDSIVGIFLLLNLKPFGYFTTSTGQCA
jgi:hypothetical protein